MNQIVWVNPIVLNPVLKNGRQFLPGNPFDRIPAKIRGTKEAGGYYHKYTNSYKLIFNQYENNSKDYMLNEYNRLVVDDVEESEIHANQYDDTIVEGGGRRKRTTKRAAKSTKRKSSRRRRRTQRR
jgi:hypothetical protein